MEPQHRNPDSLFEVALVLLGILSAGELSYYLSLPENGVPSITVLKLFTYLFLPLVGLWLLNEAVIKNSDQRFIGIIVTDFCWGLWSNSLFVYLLIVNGTTIVIASLQFVLALLFFSAIMWGYFIYAWPVDGKYFRYRRITWVSEKIIMYCLSYFMVYFSVTGVLFGRFF